MHNLDDRHCRENLYLYTYVIEAVVTLNISLNIWVGNSMLPWAKHTWKCAISPSVSLGKKTKGAFSYLLLAAGMIVTKVCVRQICLGKFSPLSSDAQVGFSQGGGTGIVFFLVHLLLLRETGPILDLCCKCSWRSQSTVWMLIILSLLLVKLYIKKWIWYK